MHNIFIQFVYYGKVLIRLNQKSVLCIKNILLLLVSEKLANEGKLLHGNIITQRRPCKHQGLKYQQIYYNARQKLL